MKRIGIRSPPLLYDILARHGEAFCRIRKPSICQVKAFDGRKPLANLLFSPQPSGIAAGLRGERFLGACGPQTPNEMIK